MDEGEQMREVVGVGGALVLLASCVQGETELVLRSDGRGAVRNVVRLGELAAVMVRLGNAEGELSGASAKMSLCEMFAKAEAGVELDVSYEVPAGADAYGVCVRVVRVEDWTQGLGDLLGGEDEGVTVEKAQGGLVVRHDGGWMYEALLGSGSGGGVLCERSRVEDAELCREVVEANALSSGELEKIWPLIVSELDLSKTPMQFRFSVEGEGVMPLEGLSEERYERVGGGMGKRFVHEQVCDMKEDVGCSAMIKASVWSFRVALPDR